MTPSSLSPGSPTGPLTITQVDAFTASPFAGNPAAVCVVEQPLDEGLMQAIAAEMNLSETAFLQPLEDGYRLRWFTPAVEVDLCGHATLASAHVLWSEGHLPPEQTACFHTNSGLLTCDLKGEWITMNFPSQPVQAATVQPELLKSLRGLTPKFVGRNGVNFLVELESAALVRSLRPDFAMMRTLPAQGVIVTSLADMDDFDFISRYFAPAAGVDEDPVTGSAHCTLGPYWQAHLGKERLRAYQASQRGGIVEVRNGRDRVYISGQAVTVMHGTMVL